VGRQEREADDGADERARAARTEATMSGLSYEAASERAAAEWDDMSLVERLMALPDHVWSEAFVDLVDDNQLRARGAESDGLTRLCKELRWRTDLLAEYAMRNYELWAEKRINELMEGDPDGDYEREHDV
jgi:hypothetical protein